MPGMPSMEDAMPGLMGDDEEMEGDHDDDMPMPQMICVLADTMSKVHYVNASLDMRMKKMKMMMDDMGSDMEDDQKLHVHFKLPRMAPFAGMQLLVQCIT